MEEEEKESSWWRRHSAKLWWGLAGVSACAGIAFLWRGQGRRPSGLGSLRRQWDHHLRSTTATNTTNSNSIPTHSVELQQRVATDPRTLSRRVCDFFCLEWCGVAAQHLNPDPINPNIRYVELAGDGAGGDPVLVLREVRVPLPPPLKARAVDGYSVRLLHTANLPLQDYQSNLWVESLPQETSFEDGAEGCSSSTSSSASSSLSSSSSSSSLLSWDYDSCAPRSPSSTASMLCWSASWRSEDPEIRPLLSQRMRAGLQSVERTFRHRKALQCPPSLSEKANPP